MPSAISAWVWRHWALVLAGLLVVFIAGGVSMTHLTRERVPGPGGGEPPAVSAPAP